jgi:hypothetical protein
VCALIREIEQIENHCKHRWVEEYRPEDIPAVGWDGDPPGKMGVDRQLPGYIPAKTIPRWKRSCLECGKVEFTYRSEPVISAQKPKFGSE